jgi:hypothetical protein
MNCNKCTKPIYGLEANMGHCYNCDEVHENISIKENKRRYKRCMKAVKSYLKKESK